MGLVSTDELTQHRCRHFGAQVTVTSDVAEVMDVVKVVKGVEAAIEAHEVIFIGAWIEMDAQKRHGMHCSDVGCVRRVHLRRRRKAARAVPSAGCPVYNAVREDPDIVPKCGQLLLSPPTANSIGYLLALPATKLSAARTVFFSMCSWPRPSPPPGVSTTCTLCRSSCGAPWGLSYVWGLGGCGLYL